MKPSYKTTALTVLGFACLFIFGSAVLFVSKHFRPHGQLSGSELVALLIAVAALMSMLAIYLVVSDAKEQHRALAELVKKFEVIRFHINSAYPYLDRDNFFELEPDEKLVAVDISWRGPTDEMLLNDIEIIDSETENPEQQEHHFFKRAEIVFLDAATGKPVEHVAYRIPSEFRFLLVTPVPSRLKAFKLLYWNYELTPRPIRLSDEAPTDGAQPTADDFRKFSRVCDEMPDGADAAYNEALNLGDRIEVNAAYPYGGLHFCAPERNEKTIAIDMWIQGMNKNVLIDRIQLLDPETRQIIDYNKTLLNYVFLDPESGQVCKPALEPLTPIVRMLFIYNVPARTKSMILSLLGSILAFEPVPIQDSEPADAPRPTEADFRTSRAAFEEMLIGEDEPDSEEIEDTIKTTDE